MSYAERAAVEDCGARYEQLRQEFTALVEHAAPEELERPVPASPEWRVRDVLAHVAGLTADLNGGDIGPGEHDAAGRQLHQKQFGRELTELVADDHLR